jgi:hypothetical protein
MTLEVTVSGCVITLEHIDVESIITELKMGLSRVKLQGGNNIFYQE